MTERYQHLKTSDYSCLAFWREWSSSMTGQTPSYHTVKTKDMTGSHLRQTYPNRWTLTVVDPLRDGDHGLLLCKRKRPGPISKMWFVNRIKSKRDSCLLGLPRYDNQTNDALSTCEESKKTCSLSVEVFFSTRAKPKTRRQGWSRNERRDIYIIYISGARQTVAAHGL